MDAALLPGEKVFECPHCEVRSVHLWSLPRSGLYTSRCVACGGETVWWETGDRWYMLFPSRTPVPRPSGDLPTDVQADYEEAAEILSRSPRGAAALLRLALQKLCAHLGRSEDRLGDAIRGLVADGANIGVQQAMDIVRITGNSAVHPGELRPEDDDADLVAGVFDLINLISRDLITRPRDLQAMYERLPESQRKRIQDRDGCQGHGS